MNFNSNMLRVIVILVLINQTLLGCSKKEVPVIDDHDFFIDLIKWKAREDTISEKNLKISEQFLTNIIEVKNEIPYFSGTQVNVTCELLDISNLLATKYNDKALSNKTEQVKQALAIVVFMDKTPALTYQKCRKTYEINFPDRKATNTDIN